MASLVISTAFSYCPWSAYTTPKLPYAPGTRPVAQGKIRIKLNSTLMVRQGCGVAFLVNRLYAQGVRLQSFERGSRGLFERNIELLHRSQRFAQLAAQLRCRLAQRV